MDRPPLLSALVVLLTIAVGLHVAGELWRLASYFADVIMLFFLAWLLAFVLKPLARLVAHRGRLSWPAAVALVYVLLVAVLGASLLTLVPIFVVQLMQFASAVAAWAETWPAMLERIQAEMLARSITLDQGAVPRPADLGAQLEHVLSTLLQGSIGFFAGALNLLVNIAIILVLSFYLMLDGDRMADGLLHLAPARRRAEVGYFLTSVDRSFGGFIRGQVIQGLIYGAGTGIVAVLAGLDYALLLAILSGALMLIPFVGAFLALVPPLLVAGLRGQLTTFIAVVVALLALQQVVLNVLAPRIMGRAVGLHPLLVFLALLVGAKVAGAAGALFGVPIAGVINAMALFVANHAGESAAAGPSAAPARGEAKPPQLASALRRIFERLWRVST